MRTRRFIGAVLLALLITLASIQPAASAGQAVSQVIHPEAIITEGGATNGIISALEIMDQTGYDDESSKYVEFLTPNQIYYGYKVFHLPYYLERDKISSILLQVNFKGPASGVQTWSWSIYDWSTHLWIKVGDTIGVTEGRWHSLTFRIRNFQRYISSTGEIRIRFASNNASNNAKLDYEALHITYLPIVTTSTPTKTTLPHKPIFVLPTTITPTFTFTPTFTPTFTHTPNNDFYIVFHQPFQCNYEEPGFHRITASITIWSRGSLLTYVYFELKSPGLLNGVPSDYVRVADENPTSDNYDFWGGLAHVNDPNEWNYQHNHGIQTLTVIATNATGKSFNQIWTIEC